MLESTSHTEASSHLQVGHTLAGQGPALPTDSCFRESCLPRDRPPEDWPGGSRRESSASRRLVRREIMFRFVKANVRTASDGQPQNQFTHMGRMCVWFHCVLHRREIHCLAFGWSRSCVEDRSGWRPPVEPRAV